MNTIDMKTWVWIHPTINEYFCVMISQINEHEYLLIKANGTIRTSKILEFGLGINNPDPDCWKLI